VTRSLRIAFIVHDYHRNGGHARYVAELATRFCDQHEVHVFSNTFEESPRSKIRHHRVPAIRSNALSTILSFVPGVTWSLMRAGRFDIVHAQGFCGLSQNVMTAHISQTAWFAAVEAASQRQGLRKRVFRWIAERLERQAFYPKAAKAFIAVSHKLKHELAQYHGLTDQVTAIHHGIDCQTFHPDNRSKFRHEVRSDVSIDDSKTVALYVGDWQKAGSTLVRALQATSGVHLMIVTKTPRSIVEQEINQANLASRVTLVPSTRQIERYYAAADMFVFPSFYDTFGMVVAEAMASGLPVIVSRQTGASEWVEHQVNGMVIESSVDSQGFAMAMAELANQAEVRSRLGSAARATALEHSWDRVADETMMVYQSVLRSESKR
jgi:UDP-glucose:(heptosyl)LPS alpha-1,3-glucosyltransferase